MFINKTFLITGGTGSFGNAVIQRLLKKNIKEIRVFSRDEKKQDHMRTRYNDNRLKFYIGDVRERRSISDAMINVDYVFHAAALKQVPTCEFHPMEAVRTNILGTDNVLHSAISAGVERVVCLSTDKAVYPINAMGVSKSMMEKLMVAASRIATRYNTVICGTRYGNVMASRGSVIPLFVDQVINGKNITITDPTMTRFMMTLEDAVDLVFFAFNNGKNGDIFVQKAPAATVETLAQAILESMNKPDHPISIIGSRHGEKLYESLLTREELAQAQDMENYYRIPPDTRDLNYNNYINDGDLRITKALHSEEYNSHNTVRLDVEGVKNLLMKLQQFKMIALGEKPQFDE